MHLASIHLRSAPGLPSALALTGLGPGLILLLGPNGSGKSTLGRCVQWALWPAGVPTAIEFESVWVAAPGEPPRTARAGFGQVRWDPAPPAVPPEAAEHWRLTIGDLLQATGANDAAIAREIDRALNGGLDLPAARAGFRAPARPTPTERSAVRAARDDWRGALDAANELAREEAALATLRAEARAAGDAHEARALVTQALALARARDEVGARGADLAGFPAAMGSLRPTLPREIAAKRQDAQQAADEAAAARRAVSAIADRLARLAFAGAPPSDVDLAAWSRRADDLATLAREVQAARRAADAAAEAARAAGAAVQLDPAAPPPDPERLAALEAALEARRQARQAVADAERELAGAPGAGPALPPERLGTAIDALLRWSRAPEASAPGPQRAPRTATLAALGLAVLVLAAALVGAVVSGGWLAVAAAAAMFLPLLLLAWGPATAAPTADEGATVRRRVEQEWGEGPPAPPAAWSQASVKARLDALVEEQVAAVDARERSRRRADAAARLQGRLAERHTAEAGATAAIAALGLPPTWADASLARQAALLRAADEARARRAAAASEAERLGAAFAADLAAAERFVRAVDPTAGVLSDVAGVHAALRALSERRSALVQATSDRADRQAAADQAERRARKAEDDHRALWNTVGLAPGDDATLAAWMGRREEHAELVARHRDAARDVERLERALAAHPDLRAMDAAAAATKADALETLASAFAARTREVTALEHRLEAAGAGRGVQDARARVEQGEQALEAARERSWEDALALDVLDWLADTAGRDRVPQLLARARSRLLAFTHGAYRLEVAPGPSFVAVDTRDHRPHRLSELSDGTRIQLLLAARLAFVEHAEAGGPKLPIFLDEVLSTTDPARFARVGASLLALAAEGRQLFYATADDAEVAQWRQLCAALGAPAPTVVVLAPRADDRPWSAAPSAPDPRPEVPPPASADARAYADTLGVPRPRLHDPADGWSVVLLLHDDLHAAHRCLEARLATGGQLRALAAAPGVLLPVDAALAAKVAARIDVVDAALEAKRVGRDRPLSWEVVAGSGAVSAIYETDARQLLAEHRDRPRVWLQAMAQLRSFRKTSVTRLEEALREAGCLDDRPPLPADEVRARAAAGAARHLSSGVLGHAELFDLVDWVARLVDAEG